MECSVSYRHYSASYFLYDSIHSLTLQREYGERSSTGNLKIIKLGTSTVESINLLLNIKLNKESILGTHL